MNKRIRFIVALTAVAFSVLSFPAAAQSADPWLGTWKVNLAKSTYSPGPKPTTAATVKIEPWQGGMKTTIDATNAQGQPTHTETIGKFDGKDNPVSGAAAPNTTTEPRIRTERSAAEHGHDVDHDLGPWVVHNCIAVDDTASIVGRQRHQLSLDGNRQGLDLLLPAWR